MRRKHYGLTRELDDRREFLERIDVHPVDVRIAAQGIGCDQHRVAIRGRLCRGLDADIAVGAGLVLDDDLLPQTARQILADEAGAHVGRAAGRERYDETNRPARPVLPIGSRNGGNQHKGRDDKAQLHHWKMVLLSRIDYPIGSSLRPTSSDAAIEVPACRSPAISPSTWAR